jgi:hypothetical protein
VKNLFKTFLLLAAMTVTIPSKSGITPATTLTTMMDPSEANRLTNRLTEIQAMDKKILTAREKRTLRKEVRSIQKVQSSSGGVYLSVGAIIIIVLLLILLL